MRRIGKQLFEVVARRVVESESRSASKLCVEVFETLTFELPLPLEDLRFGISKNAIEPP
jgi:hypothetical protein